MITVKDWVAHIPQEEKRIAYVGEHESEERRFLLTGEDAAAYAGWTFHLDMQFDVSTVTSTSEKQVQTITEDEKETMSETSATRSVKSQKETATERNVEVDCAHLTDIAYLSQQVTGDGLVLIWKVLSQHTQLPGRLWATLRAVGAAGQVKKSAVMVFDVESSVKATAAAPIAKSEFEQMEENMDRRVTQVETLANQAAEDAARLDGMLEQLLPVESAVLSAAQEVEEDATAASVAADKAEAAAAVTNAVLRESAVYVGTEEPQDEKITVWINPEGEATIDQTYTPESENAQSGVAVSQAVAPKINRAELADYIVEQGAANGWVYRKWNSGLAECWGSASVEATITTAWGGLFSADGLQSRDPFNVSFPFAFAQAPQVTATLKSSGTTAAILVVPGWGSAATTTRTGSYDLCRGTAMVEARTYTVCYYAMGSWK